MAFWDRFKKQRGVQAPSSKKDVSKVVKEELKSSPESSKSAVRGGPSDTKLAYRILLAPVQSEKAARLGSENQYVFSVASTANKIEIKEAIFRVYGVRPVAVNIIRLPRKTVRYGKNIGKEKMRVKAVVTLPRGKTISIYEGV